MHATQSPLLSKRRREYINQPYQLSIIQDEIHKFPECMRKSLRLNKHKQKTNYLRKLNQSFGTGGGSVREEADRLNINICRALHKEKEMQMFASLSPPGRRMEEYENTADRMMDMRRRLSPVKFPQQKNHPRTVISEDSVRGKEAVQNQTVFLNIEKLNLIKIYSQIERNIDTSRGNSIETRYLESSTVPHSPQEEREGEGEKDLREVVVSLRKTLREGRSMKWPSSNFKVRTKPFLPPFQRYFYRDFLWKVAFSNGILLQPIPEDAKFKVFVGRGNNSQLVRSLIKRRPWWSFTERWQDANLVWTQLKINNYFALQSNAQSPHFTQLKQPLPKEVALRNQLNHKIMNESDVLLWDSYWSKFRKVEEKITEDLSKRKYYIKKDHLINTLPASTTANKTIRMQNHLPQNYIIGNKKALLYTMSKHYQSIGKKVFNYLPLSFHVKKGLNDEEYNAFLKRYYERKKEAKNNGYNNVWIVKPGELTNRGNGIIVCFSLQEIKSILKRGGVHEDGTPKTFILQEYIEKPFLYQRRKFDIRHYMLATVVNGRFKGYWFKRGYIRTSSNQYTLSHSQASVHLTNDAVQKFLPDYGRYQKGNKLSYEEFQAYLEKQYAGRYNFFEEVYPQMKAMATDALRASGWGMDPSRKQHNFQLFGMDFMIDGQFKPWLIEINTNPCLQLSCPLLADIIPALIENTLKLCMDSVVCPPCDFVEKRPRFQDNALVKNEFELVCECMAGEGDKQGQKGEGTYPRVQLDRKEYDREEDEVFEDDGQSFDD